jgi:type I protein arginine methyltransferase
LINYIRSRGVSALPITSAAIFEDDRYLKPVLGDDALLYSFEDDINSGPQESPGGDCEGVEAEVSSPREELAHLKSQFAAYREEVQKALAERLADDTTSESGLDHTPNGTSTRSAAGKGVDQDTEAGYFSSYSYNAIHESMLKDTIRTDAYRDFIYDNKQLFQDKVVLDVGCGTGILSMFCAKAGARKVIAVDNSDIIDKARQIVFENGLQNSITCLRGKIEEVTLPVAKVDIIVSEWMGYCLLYESMLDSVIHARDKYLATDGLMVPSHAVLRIAPLADSELVASHVDFWKDVYGFRMTGMLENVYDEALIRSVEPGEIAAENAAFLELDLHQAKTTDLTFCEKFKLTMEDQIEELHGFVIWFDIYFMASRLDVPDTSAEVEKAAKHGVVAFSTGPKAVQTHWQQGALLIKAPFAKVRQGDVLTGLVGFQRKQDRGRSLDIEVQWQLPSMPESRRQVWSLD